MDGGAQARTARLEGKPPSPGGLRSPVLHCPPAESRKDLRRQQQRVSLPAPLGENVDARLSRKRLDVCRPGPGAHSLQPLVRVAHDFLLSGNGGLGGPHHLLVPHHRRTLESRQDLPDSRMDDRRLGLPVAALRPIDRRRELDAGNFRGQVRLIRLLGLCTRWIHSGKAHPALGLLGPVVHIPSDSGDVGRNGHRLCAARHEKPRQHVVEVRRSDASFLPARADADTPFSGPNGAQDVRGMGIPGGRGPALSPGPVQFPEASDSASSHPVHLQLAPVPRT